MFFQIYEVIDHFDRFKEMRWEVNHGVSGCKVTDMVFEGACLYSKWDSMECNTTGE